MVSDLEDGRQGGLGQSGEKPLVLPTSFLQEVPKGLMRNRDSALAPHKTMNSAPDQQLVDWVRIPVQTERDQEMWAPPRRASLIVNTQAQQGSAAVSVTY